MQLDMSALLKTGLTVEGVKMATENNAKVIEMGDHGHESKLISIDHEED